MLQLAPNALGLTLPALVNSHQLISPAMDGTGCLMADTTRSTILMSLLDHIEPDREKARVSKRIDEITAKGIATTAAIGGAYYLALKQWKLPPPSKFSRRTSAIDFAKRLVQSKNNEESVTAIIGLLNICARVLLTVPELKDLGYRVTQVVQSERLEDYFDDA